VDAAQAFPPPIGVPNHDAFAYTDMIFERLRAKWKRGEKIEMDEWGTAITG
jgi:hypothetical protein